MAVVPITVQLASFKGIYTLPGSVFTPGPLVWSHPNATKADGNNFINTRGKTFVIINNKDDADLKVTLDATAVVAESPDSLAVTDPDLIIAAGDYNILGPFTGNFEALTLITMIWGESGGTFDVANVDVAVVKLP